MAQWVGFVRQASRLAATFVAAEIRDSVTKRRAEVVVEPSVPTTAPITPAEAGDRGCPVCTVHERVSTAKGHIEGIADLAETTGSIPEVMRPTVRLARLDLEAAQTTLAVVRSKAPPLGDRCDAVEAALRGALVALPSPEEVTPESAAGAVPALTLAHHEARDLAIAFYELERRVHEGDRLRALYDEARMTGMDADAFYARLKDELTRQ